MKDARYSVDNLRRYQMIAVAELNESFEFNLMKTLLSIGRNQVKMIRLNQLMRFVCFEAIEILKKSYFFTFGYHGNKLALQEKNEAID